MTPRFYRRMLCRAAVGAGLAASVGGCRGPLPAPPAGGRFAKTRRLMGVPWTITVQEADAAQAEDAIAAGFAEVERLERILSDYDPASELCRLSAAAPTTEPVVVSADLWSVLERAVLFRDATGGAFDPSVGPLTTLWRQARRTGRLPRPDRLAAARAAVGAGALVLVPERRAVLLPRPGTRLDLGGIGMGYAADRAMEALASRGIRAAMIDASGDILVSAAPPGARGWKIKTAPHGGAPTSTPALELADAALTTSGDAFQAVEIDGVRYSHIVDPRTGLGVAGRTAVMVIAPDCTTADARATALNVLGPRDGLEAVTRFPGTAALFSFVEEGAIRQVASPGWPAVASQPAADPGKP
jgi:thiamine biosynthesis lipoprotein